MDEFASEIDNFLRTAREAAERLSEDERLDPRYAAQEAQKLWQDAVAEARRLAAEKLAALEKRYGDLSKRLAEETARVDKMLEPERISAAVNVASIQADTLGDPADFRRIVRRAIATGDRHTLQAWADVGLPILAKRLPDLRMRPGDLEALKAEVDEALASLEPDALKKARQEAAEAEAELETLQFDLGRVNKRWAMRNGGRGPLDISEGTTTVGFQKNGRMRITYRGRWP